MIDGWLLDLFPGRFLEEIDQIDVYRALRAREAKRYEAVEARRRLMLAGKLTGSDLDKEEWRIMLEMDAIEASLGD